MKAVCTVSFRGVRDGQYHATTFAVGDELIGSIAEIAVENGWAVRSGEPGPKEHQSLGAAPEPQRGGREISTRPRRVKVSN